MIDIDRRKEKRYFTRMGYDAKYEAHLLGQDAAYCGRPYRNPYPQGVRHDLFKDGYDNADPMGDHYGRNV